jgi:hypothetical protein
VDWKAQQLNAGQHAGIALRSRRTLIVGLAVVLLLGQVDGDPVGATVLVVTGQVSLKVSRPGGVADFVIFNEKPEVGSVTLLDFRFSAKRVTADGGQGVG